MEKLHGLKERICSFDNLYEAYVAASKGKKTREEVMEFTFFLEENLIGLQEELLSGSYRTGPYREFYVKYPKPRLVMALRFRDRVVQWAVYRQIDPYIDKRFIEHSCGCRRRKGTLAAAQKLLEWVRKADRKPGNYYIIKGDISRYFYRVDHEIIMDLYREICDEEWFLSLMDVIINNPDVPFGLPEGMGIDDCPRNERLFEVGQPIGNLTSQETANIYLDGFDKFCKHELKIHEYIRYMDDFAAIVEGKRNAEEITARMSKYLKGERRLDMSKKSKIVPVHEGIEFVGYRVSPHGIRIRKKTVRHTKRSLKHVSARFANGEITYEEARETAMSYIGMTKHVNGASIRRWIESNYVLQRN